MRGERPVRLLIVAPGQPAAALVLAHAFRNAGMEVICLDAGERPEILVNVAIQEDVDVIGIGPASLWLFARVAELLAARGAADIPVFAAAEVSAPALRRLEACGVAAVFPAPSPDGVRQLLRHGGRLLPPAAASEPAEAVA